MELVFNSVGFASVFSLLCDLFMLLNSLYFYRQIQKHPNEEKYYRIFKGRAKLRKHVWTVRNAKLFMTASGWTEVKLQH